MPGTPGAISLPTSDTDGAYSISWGAASGTKDRYELEEQKDGGPWVRIHNTSATSKSVSGKSTAVYKYRSRACNDSAHTSRINCSGWTAQKTITVVRTPSSITVPNSDNDGAYTISWASVTGAASYELREKINSASYVTVYNGTATSKSFSSKGIATYQYAIRAIENGVSGDWKYSSAFDNSVAPSTFTVPSGTDQDGAFDISWSPAAGADTYILQQQKNGGAWSTIQNTAATTKSVSGLTSGVYKFQVASKYNSVTSNYKISSDKKVVLTPASITVPTTVNTSGLFDISWAAVSGASDYIVQAQVNAGTWSTVYTGTATSHTVVGLNTADHTFRVAARYTGTAGSYRTSSPVRVVRTPTDITVPATDTNGAYTISWVGSAGVDQYVLQEQVNGGSWSNVYTGTATSTSFSGRTTNTYKYRVKAQFSGDNSGYQTSGNVIVAIQPAPPLNFVVPSSSINGTYTISWGAPPTPVTEYVLEESSNGGSTWVEVSSQAGLSVTINKTQNGTWHYRVKACNSYSGLTPCSVSTAADSVTVSLPAFSSNENPSLDGGFTLTWTLGSEHYVLKQNGVEIASGGNSPTGGYRTVSVGSSGSYNYDLSLFNWNSGDNHWEPIFPNPHHSLNVSVVLVPGTSVIQWIKSNGLISTFSKDGTFEIITAGSGPIETVRWQLKPAGVAWPGDGVFETAQDSMFNISGLEDGSHDIRVKNCNAAGCSASWSTPANLQVLRAPRGDFNISQGGNFDEGEISVSWTADSGQVDHYWLRESENALWGDWQDLGISRSYSPSNAKPDGDYQYEVYACNTSGCSEVITSSNVTIDHPVPDQPSNLVATQNGQVIDLIWDKVATGYDDYYQFRVNGETWLPTTSDTTAQQPLGSYGSYFLEVRACNVTPGEAKCSEPVDTEFAYQDPDPSTPAWAKKANLDIQLLDAGFADPQLKQHQNVGVVGGRGGVSGGAATYNIPIEIPPGRNGVQPQVSLSYSSRTGNGVVGKGWSLGAGSQISRCPQTMAQDGQMIPVQYLSSDRLCLDGQRLIRVSGSYGTSGAVYRTELDSFARITQSGDLNGTTTWFKVELKSGRVRYYGDDADSRHVADGVSAIKSWAISREEDPVSNSINYVYQGFGGGEYQLSDIYYTGSGQENGNRRISFIYEPGARPDIASSYLAGGLTRQTKRLEKIAVYYQADLVREYSLSYRLSEATGSSLLQEISLCGTGGQCLEPTTFEWADTAEVKQKELLGSASYTGGNHLNSGKSVTPLFPEEKHIDRLMPRGDFNGDGVRDWPGYFMSAEGAVTGTFNPESGGCVPFPGSIRCVELDANNDGKTDTWRDQGDQLQIGISNGDGSFTWISTPIGLPGLDHILDARDYNGDGWVDLQIRRGDSISDNELYLYLHTGNTAAPYANNGQLVTTFQYDASSWSHRSSVEFVGDVTGNGLPDLLLYDNTIYVNGVGEVTSPQPTPTMFLFAERNGSGVSFVPVATNTPQNGLDKDLYFYYLLDINGDGLPDWVNWRGEQDGLYYRLNKGGVFTNWQFVELDSPLETRRYRYFNDGDMSGEFLDGLKYVSALKKYDRGADGKMGLIYPKYTLVESCLEAYDSGGTKNFCGDDLYDVFNSGTAGSPNYESFDVTEVDHSFYGYEGLHFVEQADGSFRVEQYSPNISGTAYNSAVIDAFGNGLSDFVYSYGCANYPGSCTVPETAGHSPGVYVRRNRGSATGDELYEPTDMLVSVENSLGFRDEWHYRPLSSRDDRYHSGDKPFYESADEQGGYFDNLDGAVKDDHFAFTSSMYVVAEHRQSNGLGPGALNRKQYRYKGAVFNNKGRGFQGFHTIVEEDLAANVETQSDFHQIFPLAGKLYKQRKWELGDRGSDDDSASAFVETDFQWQFWPLGGHSAPVIEDDLDYDWTALPDEPYFVGIRQQSSSHRTLGTRAKLYQQAQTTEFDQWGNVVLAESRYEEGPSGGLHIVTSSTSTDYSPADTTSWWLDKTQSQTVTTNPIQNRDGAVEIGADTDVQQSVVVTFESWNDDVRKPTSILTDPSTGKWNRVVTEYTAHGLAERVTTTAEGETESRFVATTQFSSDSYFPQVIENALGHPVTTITNPKFGKPDSVTDANGLRTDYAFDDFGRVITVTAPYDETLGLKAAPNVHTAQQWCPEGVGCLDGSGSGRIAGSVYKTIQQQAGAPEQVAYHDALGRVIQAEVQAFSGTDWVVTRTQYNALGQVTFESAPHYASSPNSYGTRYDGYDTLGRTLGKTVDQTDGQVLDIDYTHDYQDSFTTQVTANGRIMYRTFNGLQQLTQTVDALQGSTDYAYDGAGNPIVLRDAASNSITAKHNALGQKDWVDDPNMGFKSFTYTGFGEVETETDARQQVTEYHYDRIGRLEQREVNGTPQAEWVYDTAANGIGLPHIEQTSDGGFTRTYRYDTLSRPDQVTTNIDGEDFLTVSHYDSNYGRLKGLTYPSGLTLQYGYNDAGYQFRTRNAVSGYSYREITQMDAWGEWEFANVAAGNYIVGRDFHAATGQMAGTAFDSLVQSHQLLSYDYDNFGNLWQQTVSVPGESPSTNVENHYYDALNRLDYSTRTDGPTIDYDYDAIGNLLKKDDFASSYSYIGGASGGPNAVKGVVLVGGGTVTYGYDANGNRTHENGVQQVWYNAFNKPTRISRNGVDLYFSYGADQMRYKQVNQGSGKTTVHIDKLFERIGGGSETQYRHFIGDIAVVTSTETASETSHEIGFTHRDRLGSTVAVGDESGNLRETHSFDPFGKPRLGNILDKTVARLESGFTTRGFTDHEHLDDVELIHMNGRAYDYNLGRFLSVDPIIQAPGNSQSMNPYSYIMNNPLAGTDPTGFASCSMEDPGSCNDVASGLGEGDTADITQKQAVTGSRIKRDVKVGTMTGNGNGTVSVKTGAGNFTASTEVGALSNRENSTSQHGVASSEGNAENAALDRANAFRGNNISKSTDVIEDGKSIGKRVSIEGGIYFDGDVSEEFVNASLSGINNTWDGTFEYDDGYFIDVSASMNSTDSSESALVTVRVVPPDSENLRIDGSYRDAAATVGPNGQGNIIWFSQAAVHYSAEKVGYIMAHEFGHNLGFRDAYFRRKRFLPGHEGSIMGGDPEKRNLLRFHYEKLGFGP